MFGIQQVAGMRHARIKVAAADGEAIYHCITRTVNGEYLIDDVGKEVLRKQLWQVADSLQGSIDAAECKHGCLGLLFQKYMSDASERKHAAPRGQVAGRDARALLRLGIRPRYATAIETE